MTSSNTPTPLPQQDTALTRLWKNWRGFILFVAVMLVFRSAIADWNQVPTGSMIPSILVGDRIVVNKLAYDLRIPFTMIRIARLREPERNNIVTFASPKDEKLLVKRVIGLPGDVVELRQNRLFINDQASTYDPVDAATNTAADADEQYLFYTESLGKSEHVVMFDAYRPANAYQSFAARRVPDDHYLVLGDNRDHSQDSRVIGFVHRARILGQANSVAFSLDYDNYYAPRMDRFFADLP